MTSALVTTEKLTKVFRSWSLRGPNPSLTALAGCTLQVQQGEIFGLLGPNGAGKTTLLRLLLGFLKPTSGRAHIDQKDCYSQSIAVRHRVSYLPGDVRLFRNMNGHRFLEFMSQLRDNTHLDRSYQLADRLNLDLSRRISNMSTGMKQKLALVNSLATDAPLIILDEPTSNLDPTVRKNVLDTVIELQASGRTIIFSSHVLSEVEAVCDRVAIMRSGQLVHTQPMDALKQRHRIRARLQAPLPAVPERFQDAVTIQDARQDMVVIDIAGDLARLLHWLSEAGLSDLEISPIGLSAVYEQFHSVELPDQTPPVNETAGS
ncbi:MAG: ABC transporter ATP-binding protein [Pirellulaceae bacterium]|nr:ABC transporter ATP-binding protein [Pirellulaceae bacterium]